MVLDRFRGAASDTADDVVSITESNVPTSPDEIGGWFQDQLPQSDIAIASGLSAPLSATEGLRDAFSFAESHSESNPFASVASDLLPTSAQQLPGGGLLPDTGGGESTPDSVPNRSLAVFAAVVAGVVGVVALVAGVMSS